MFYSPYYGFGPGMGFLLIAMVFVTYAQMKVKTTFNRYLQVNNKIGFTGYEVARKILDRNGLRDVPVEITPGQLTDHYDPRTKVVRLSPHVYKGNTIASISVAAHECGHAIQHGNGYFPLTLRNAIAPIANFGSRFVWILVMAGFVFGATGLIDLGILFYLASVIFQIITLPVELNASSRAIEQMDMNGVITVNEIEPCKKVLRAAALTYIGAMAVAIAQLFRLILLRNQRD
ncbi:MAG: zinc metallopeptidase [Anaeromicrobium sp.]|jgi:Zn-dependent membrane protease YugP|uniref:zinc metallopeptidase n=1 Tax=Anaeromicrobium sp. TaxID=1929132 RepID=UPI0025F5440A|nr:zinc metallopeptidase [Anaeromicrobium sp.]MCT4594900.1 zinc metallopeptidase [Anaeromicrobium sp.]